MIKPNGQELKEVTVAKNLMGKVMASKPVEPIGSRFGDYARSSTISSTPFRFKDMTMSDLKMMDLY